MWLPIVAHPSVGERLLEHLAPGQPGQCGRGLIDAGDQGGGARRAPVWPWSTLRWGPTPTRASLRSRGDRGRGGGLLVSRGVELAQEVESVAA